MTTEQTSPAADTPGIAAFIEARLKKRESAAKRCRELGDRIGTTYGHRVPPEAEMNLGDLAYFALHKQADQTVAEVAKGRAILALHRPDEQGFHCLECQDVSSVLYPCQTVRLLAAIDADHPDYDPDWKPVAT